MENIDSAKNIDNKNLSMSNLGRKLKNENNNEIRLAIKKLFLKMFTKASIKSDSYLLSNMSSVLFFPLEIVYKHPEVQEITKDVSIIREALGECPSVVVTPEGVWPNIKVEQNTIILRDIPGDTPVSEVQKIFLVPSPSSSLEPAVASFASTTQREIERERERETEDKDPLPVIRGDMNDIWFATFSSESAARRALERVRKQSFRGRSVRAALKSESLSKSFFSGPSYRHVAPSQSQRSRSSSEDLSQSFMSVDGYVHGGGYDEMYGQGQGYGVPLEVSRTVGWNSSGMFLPSPYTLPMNMNMSMSLPASGLLPCHPYYPLAPYMNIGYSNINTPGVESSIGPSPSQSQSPDMRVWTAREGGEMEMEMETEEEERERKEGEDWVDDVSSVHSQTVSHSSVTESGAVPILPPPQLMWMHPTSHPHPLSVPLPVPVPLPSPYLTGGMMGMGRNMGVIYGDGTRASTGRLVSGGGGDVEQMMTSYPMMMTPFSGYGARGRGGRYRDNQGHYGGRAGGGGGGGGGGGEV
mmetsp:Transcript_14053/g.14154  ORF Transcript_14053/g.14154 Transcript_14053/m.14154 type:complete len:525 (-) Transcript_14053:232-1806(-)